MNYSITTKRLLIRNLEPAEAPLVLKFYTDNREHFDPFETDKPAGFYTLDFQASVLTAEAKQRSLHGGIRYYIFLKDKPNTIIGTVSFSNIIGGSYNHCVIGYKMHKDYLRQGYMQEAMEACIEQVTKLLKIHRIEAYIQKENIPSINLIQKLGFEAEGIARDYIRLKGHYVDLLRYVFISKLSRDS